MLCCFLFQAEDGIRSLVRSRGLGDVSKGQVAGWLLGGCWVVAGWLLGGGRVVAGWRLGGCLSIIVT